MEAEDLDVATAFCQLVESTDLFEYLGISAEAPWSEVEAALTAKRRRLQAMQANPKFKESASFLIRNYRRIERVAQQPQAHLAAMREAREEEHVPMLLLALEGVLADGRVTAREQAFLRQASLDLGISQAKYEAVLAEEVARRQIVIEVADASDPDGPWHQRLKGADGHGWWDAPFTRLLLDCIGGGPGDMVDVYCRAGLSAATVLPERPQLTWTGIDRSAERLAEAGQGLARQSGGSMSRIVLRQGTPDALPLEDDTMDYAVAIRAMANRADTRPVIREAKRVLRAGGRLIAAEPDGLAETFYFEGPLARYNAAFHVLCAEVDRRMGAAVDPAGRPGLALGPTLAMRMTAEGFTPGPVRVHASHNLRPLPFGRLARRLRSYPEALARRVNLDPSDVLAMVLTEVSALEADLDPATVGVGGHVLPMFLAVGDLPEG